MPTARLRGKSRGSVRRRVDHVEYHSLACWLFTMQGVEAGLRAEEWSCGEAVTWADVVVWPAWRV